MTEESRAFASKPSFLEPIVRPCGCRKPLSLVPFSPNGIRAIRRPSHSPRNARAPVDIVIDLREYSNVIESFGDAVSEDLFNDKRSKATRAFPSELRRVARRKLLYLHEATNLTDLRVPPGNRIERLKGDRKEFHSIRINDTSRKVWICPASIRTGSMPWPDD